MINIKTVVTSVALSMVASAGMAAVVTINNVTGEWTGTTPTDVYGLNSSSSGSYSEINWGDPANGPHGETQWPALLRMLERECPDYRS